MPRLLSYLPTALETAYALRSTSGGTQQLSSAEGYVGTLYGVDCLYRWAIQARLPAHHDPNHAQPCSPSQEGGRCALDGYLVCTLHAYVHWVVRSTYQHRILIHRVVSILASAQV